MTEGELFEWDTGKSIRCYRERGFDFHIAARVFEDIVLEETSAHDYGEPRFQAIGQVDFLILFVVWTPRGTKRRIISARPASLKERGRFHAYRETIEQKTW